MEGLSTHAESRARVKSSSKGPEEGKEPVWGCGHRWVWPEGGWGGGCKPNWNVWNELASQVLLRELTIPVVPGEADTIFWFSCNVEITLGTARLNNQQTLLFRLVRGRCLSASFGRVNSEARFIISSCLPIPTSSPRGPPPIPDAPQENETGRKESGKGRSWSRKHEMRSASGPRIQETWRLAGPGEPPWSSRLAVSV